MSVTKTLTLVMTFELNCRMHVLFRWHIDQFLFGNNLMRGNYEWALSMATYVSADVSERLLLWVSEWMVFDVRCDWCLNRFLLCPIIIYVSRRWTKDAATIVWIGWIVPTNQELYIFFSIPWQILSSMLLRVRLYSTIVLIFIH